MLLFLAAVAVFVAAMLVGSAIGAALASLVRVTWRGAHALAAIDDLSPRAMQRDAN